MVVRWDMPGRAAAVRVQFGGRRVAVPDRGHVEPASRGRDHDSRSAALSADARAFGSDIGGGGPEHCPSGYRVDNGSSISPARLRVCDDQAERCSTWHSSSATSATKVAFVVALTLLCLELTE
eukprot:429249-Rhodomonas_salina.1